MALARRQMKKVRNNSKSSEQKRVLRGIIFAALGGTCWGFSGTCAQLLTSQMGVPVAWITCVRLSSAALLFLTACLVLDRERLFAALKDWRSLAGIVVFSILGILMTQVSYLSAISYTNAGTGTVMERLGLLMILAVVCIKGRRLPKKLELLGLVFAIVGIFLIATKGSFTSLAIAPEGLFWGLMSGVSFTFYTLLPGKYLAKWGSFVVTGLAMFSGGFISSVVVQPWNIPLEITPGLVIIMVLMVVVGTFCAYLFYLQGISDAGPVRASLVSCVEPVSATVLSAVWLHTYVGIYDLVGCALIITMVFLVTDRNKLKEKSQVRQVSSGKKSLR